METRKCLYCKGEIIGKRDDAKFCSNTCKAKHWEEKKQPSPALFPVKEERNVTSQLRGVLVADENAELYPENVQNTEPVLKTIEVAAPNPERITLNNEHRRLLDVRMQLVSEIEGLQNKMQGVIDRNGNPWVVGLTGSGAFVGNKSSEGTVQGTILGGLAGLAAGSVMKMITSEVREEDKRRECEKITGEIQSRVKKINDNDNILRGIDKKLRTIPFFAKAKKQVAAIDQPIIKSEDQINIPEKDESPKPLNGLHKDVSDVSLTATYSDKIINSRDLKKMDFKVLDFKERWKLFFGNPSVNFHCIIHGMPGEGKSTFAIQFAKYLAENIGRVIYISGEEGFTKTFKDKFLNNDSISKYLDVADLRTFEDIIRNILPEVYNFIFIDSLDNMRIDAGKLKKIRERYKNSALITISQSTKDGKIKGSNELVHDCDISVSVENGIAKTNKNRFKEKWMTFEVFGDKNNDAGKLIHGLFQ
jgi:hypothetical protein